MAYLYTFITASAAALRTYGLGSAADLRTAMSTIAATARTRMPLNTRRAMARMRGLGSARSRWKVLIESRARSGSDGAQRRR